MNSIAWVVPVPAVPELASMNARDAKFMFFGLGLRSRPNVLPIVQIAIFVSLLVLICFLIEILLNRFFAKLIKAGAKPWAVSGLRIAIVVIVCFMLAVVILVPRLGIKGVDVLKAETVGIYDVKVIKGDDAGAVTQWLKDNGFGFGQADSKVFDQYVKKDWCFVTAKVAAGVDSKTEGAISEGLAAPLILRFDSKEAIYPMALTGTIGFKTKVLLYVFSDHKMECGEKLRLTFFGEKYSPLVESVCSEVEPEGFFTSEKGKLWKMSKFKGTLKPDQMKEDIVFTQAKDDEPYRKTRWY